MEIKRTYTIAEILTMQDELNELYIPNWKQVMRPSMYFTQIIDEMSELLRSGVEYKWWSDVPVEQFDSWNVKIEATDIIFFLASMFRLGCTDDELEDLRSSEQPPHEIPDEMRFVHTGNKIDHDVVSAIMACIASAMTEAMPLDMADIIHCVAQCAGMTSEEASAAYAAKYELNKFRISSDYKSGRYKKVVDGVEDNARLRVVVQKFIDSPAMDLNDVRTEVVNMFFEDSSDK